MPLPKGWLRRSRVRNEVQYQVDEEDGAATRAKIMLLFSQARGEALSASQICRALIIGFEETVRQLSELWVEGQIRQNLRVAANEYSFKM